MFLYSARFKVCHPYIEDDISVVGNEETILVSDIRRMSTLSLLFLLENWIYLLKSSS